MKTIMILLVAALMLAGCEACHNSTGACHHNGKFECLDGSMVTHAQRCNGVEDCKDGMDEFMCPRTAHGHHEVHEEASCGPSCACEVATTTVASTSTSYFNFAVYAPTWGILMTGTPVAGRWGCNPLNTKTSAVQMVWYKKGGVANAAGNCVGNTRKRGFICCGRQQACTCVAAGTARCT